MKKLIFLLGVALAVSALRVDAAPSRVVVYYPDYRGVDKQTLASRPFKMATHAVFAFLHFNAQGDITYKDQVIVAGGKIEVKVAALRDFSAAVRAQGALPMVSFGGGGGAAEFRALAPNAAARKRFAVNALVLCRQYRLAGIDLDWEHPQDETEGAQYVALVRQIRAAFKRVEKKQRLLLTLATTGTAWYGRHLPDALMGLVDWYNIMDYDHIKRMEVSGANTKVAAPHSSYSRAKITIDYWVNKRGLPRAKAVLGVPFYGWQFVGAGGPDQPYTKKEAWTYADLAARFRDGTARKVSIPAEGPVEAQCAYLGERGGGVVYFNGPELIARKARLVAEEQLGGIMAWELGQDEAGRGALMRHMRAR